jgi:hypothetical protein
MPDVAHRKTYTSTMEMTRMAPIKCLRVSQKRSATEGPKGRDFAALILEEKGNRAGKTVCARGDTVVWNIQRSGKIRSKNVKKAAARRKMNRSELRTFANARGEGEGPRASPQCDGDQQTGP